MRIQARLTLRELGVSVRTELRFTPLALRIGMARLILAIQSRLISYHRHSWEGMVSRNHKLIRYDVPLVFIYKAGITHRRDADPASSLS